MPDCATRTDDMNDHARPTRARVQTSHLASEQETDMTLEERSNLVLAFARVLYVNGQATDQTLAAAGRLGQALGLRATIMPRWGELPLHAQDGERELVAAAAAS